MPVPRRFAALLVVVALGVPATASAQTTTIPRGGADVSNTPPVPLSGPPAAAPSASSQLPNTGSDPRVLFVCGVALALIGAGLRLRTADAELY